MCIRDSLSTVRHADHIVVLEHGRIVQQGRHDELLQKGGAYAELWRVQAGLRPDEAMTV